MRDHLQPGKVDVRMAGDPPEHGRQVLVYGPHEVLALHVEAEIRVVLGSVFARHVQMPPAVDPACQKIFRVRFLHEDAPAGRLAVAHHDGGRSIAEERGNFRLVPIDGG